MTNKKAKGKNVGGFCHSERDAPKGENMRKQLTLKKLTLFVLSSLLCLLLAFAGIALGSSTQAFAEEPTPGIDDLEPNPAGHDDSHHLRDGSMYEIYPATCVEPGIAVAYCEDCGRNVSVVLPADGVHHRVKATYSGAKNTDGVCEICGVKTGGYNQVVHDEEEEQFVEVSGIEGSEMETVVIPAKIEGEDGVERDVRVAQGAFAGNGSLGAVEIQGAVEVGKDAFKDCTNLTTLKIDEGTETIGASAFENCTNIADVKLPDSVVSIGANAFNNTGFYNAPESWTGEDLKTLATGSFLLKVATEVPSAPAHGRRNALNDATPTASYTVADGITVIADNAFEGTSLAEVTLPAALKTVGANAFPETIATIYINDGVTAAAYTKVDGLGYDKDSLVNIYYLGGYSEATSHLAAIARLRFLSETEPDDAEHNYWHHVDGVPTPWAHLTGLKVEGAPTQFHRGDPFNAEGIVVTALYDDETDRELTADEYHLDSSAFKLEVGDYIISVSYLYVSATYEVHVLDSCKITFVYGNGSSERTESAANGSDFTLPEKPYRKGYTFTGWLVQSAGAEEGEIKQPTETFTVDGDATITAQWTVVEPTVTPDYNGGEANGTEMTAAFNEEAQTYTVTIAGAPYRKGYTFTGWQYTVDNGAGAGEAQTVENNAFTIALDDVMTVKVTAQWTVKSLELAPDYDGGEANGTEITAAFDEAQQLYTVTITGEPKYIGYKFAGWQYTLNDADPVDVENNTFTVALDDTMNVTVTAKWEKLYTVTVGDHANATVEVSATAVYTENGTAYYAKTTQVTVTVTVNNGYKLAENGVQVSGADLTEDYKFTIGEADVTITVTTAEVNVTVNVGGENASDDNVALARSEDGAKAIFTLKQPEREGYDFAGWTIQVEGGEKQESYKGSTYELSLQNSDVTVTFTATWSAIGYTLTITGAENATVTYEDNTHEPQAAYHITDVVKFKVEANGGYILESVSNGEALKADQDGYYSVTFGADNITVAVSVRQVKVTYSITNEAGGASLKLEQEGATATVTVEGTPARDGFRFDGWTIEVTGAEYTEEGSATRLTLANADVTVTYTAKWTNVYTLTVNEIPNANVSYKDQKSEYEVGDTVEITITPADGYKVTEEGITVVGAPKKVEGNVITVTFASSNVTITVEVEQVKVTVAFTEAYEGVSGSATVSGATATVTITGTPAKDGFAFTGWTSSADGGATQGDDVLTYNLKNTDVTITFTAQFEKKEVTEVNAALSVSGTAVSLKLTLTYTGYSEEELQNFKLQIGEDRSLTGTLAGKVLTFELPEELTAGTYALKLLEGDKEVYSGKTFSGTNSQFVATTGLEYSLASGELVVTFYGTSDKPLTVTEAQKIGEKVDSGYSTHVLYVTGVAETTPEKVGDHYNKFYLLENANSETKILIYSITHNGTSIAQNDTLKLHGYLTRYNGELEFAGSSSVAYPQLDERTAGESTITLGDHEGATVSEFGAGTTLQKTNGIEFTFTVTAEGDNKIYSVKAGSQTLTAKSGNQYSFTVAGNVTITVQTLKSNQRIVYKLAKSDDVIVDGAKVVIASGENLAGTLSGSYLTSISGAQFSDETITELNNATEWTLKEIKQEDASSQWEIVDASGNKLGATAAKALAFNNGTTTWTISIASSGNANITNTKSSYGSIQYNSGANPKRFLNYTSSQTAIQFYVETVETVVVPYTYDVTEVMLDEDASSLRLMMTISKQPEQEATVSLTVGGQSVEAQLDGDMVTTDPLPLESLTNGAEIVLEINDVTPTSWGGVDSTVQSIGTKNYSLSASGEKLQLNIVDTSEPEFSYNVESVTIGEKDGTQLTITIRVDQTTDKSAKLTINGNDAGSPKVANGNEFTFEVTPGDWGETWALTFTIDGKEPSKLPDTVEGTATLNDKTYTLALVDGALQITVKSIGGEDEPQEITEYNLVTDVSQLKDGYAVVFVSGTTVSGTWSSDTIKTSSGVTFGSTNNTITKLGSGNADEIYWTLKQNADNTTWSFVNKDGDLLGVTGSSNKFQLNGTTAQTSWTITITDSTNEAEIASGTTTTYYIQYNSSVGFRPYKSGQAAIKLYMSNAPAPKVDTSAADLKKAQDALDSLTVQSSVNSDTTITLDSDNGAGVTFAWTLVDDAGVATLENGNSLKIVRTDSVATVKLSATATYNDQTTDAKDFTIQVSAKSAGGDSVTEVTTVLNLDNLGIKSTSGYTNTLTGSGVTINKVLFKGTKCGQQSGNWQFQASNGEIHNDTAFPGKIKSITTVFTKGTFTLTVGTSKEPTTTSSTSPSYTAKDGEDNRFFKLKVGSSVGNLTSITIVYESPASDEVKSDLEIVPAVYTTTLNSNQSNTGASAALWISIVSVGAVVIALGAVVVIFALRKKSE